MNFLYPYGLLGLIGIPILIVIYVIKSKYTEQIVASTYLWTLSNRFLKKRKRFSMLAGLIALLLQILAISAISLSIAHPVITLPGAAHDYCFILDASGSMSMGDGESRFDKAKDKILEVIDGATQGSTYSLVLASDTPTLLFSKTEDKDAAAELLATAKVGYAEADIDGALEIAQLCFSENPGLLTYVVTDKSYTVAENVSILDVSADEVNYSLQNVEYTANEIQGKTTVIGEVVSYSGAAELTVKLYVDSVGEPVASVQISASGEPVAFSLTANTAAFEKLRVVLEGEDSQPLDNSVILYSVKNENAYDTLIVSDAPFFIKTALSAVGYADMTVIPTEIYDGQSGYGLYIFDGFVPEKLPRDGTVWFINPIGSTEGAGFTVQGEVELDASGRVELSGSSQSLIQKLTEGMTGEGLAVRKYQKIGLNRNFSTLLSYKGNPMVFTGNTELGNREIVFAFDLHSSNFPLVPDFITLVDNLIEYAFPTVIEKTKYTVGEEASINTVAGCEGIRIDSPLGSVSYLGIGAEVASFSLSEVGTYKVTMTVSGSQREMNIFSELPYSEREPNESGDAIALVGAAQNTGRDGVYDELILLFICLAVLFSADWMVYCYDKYQLR